MCAMHECDRTLPLWPSITKYLQLCLHQSAYYSLSQQGYAIVHMLLHQQTLMHPIADVFDATHSFKAMIVLLCLCNGNFDAQVTNSRGRVELQRTMVARNSHLQQCLADFCSLELVHGVHCPRWASHIVYLEGIGLCSSVAQNKQSSCSSLTWLLCFILMYVFADWLHAVALLKD